MSIAEDVSSVRRPVPIDPNRPVVPAAVAHPSRGRVPVFGMDVWDLTAWSARSTPWKPVADFRTEEDPAARLTAKEYLYSRLNRGVALPVMHRSSSRRPMSISNLPAEWSRYRRVFSHLRELGATRWSEASAEHFAALEQRWTTEYSSHYCSALIGCVRYVWVHSLYLTTDAVVVEPWPGRTANKVAARPAHEENTTLRIPEQIMGPILRAALFYVQVASGDIIAGLDESARLAALYGSARKSGARQLGRGDCDRRLRAWIEQRRGQGRGIPAIPLRDFHSKHLTDPVLDGVAQAPNARLSVAMAGLSSHSPSARRILTEAGAEVGYEAGGMDTAISPWPDTGQPWRARFDPIAVRQEMTYLRTACFIVIAFLTGARDVEVRDLLRDCAFVDLASDGVTRRHKLRGRVYKMRRAGGDTAEWVSVEPVHQAVEVLLRLNDDEAYLFAFTTGRRNVLQSATNESMNLFRDHVNDLFSEADGLYVPNDGEVPWRFTTRQLRRTLAWYIAHQPFGIVAGALQYKHAKITTFEGYAGTSKSGFAAEVAAEEAVARLDMVEDLYRDWLAGRRATGGAVGAIHAEFERVQREVGDMPGIVAGDRRERTMLEHLARTLHPGLLNDCFFKAETAGCAHHQQPGASGTSPLPLISACVRCPNAYVTTRHAPALREARAQIADRLTIAEKAAVMPPLQHEAFLQRLDDLDRFAAPLDNQRTTTTPGAAP